jgi:hypothetical protein
MRGPVDFLFWLQGYLAALECELISVSNDHKRIIEGALRVAISSHYEQQKAVVNAETKSAVQSSYPKDT